MNEEKISSKKKESTLIIYIIAAFIATFESVLTLSNIFRKGIFKKQVLSRKSNLGFDVEIRFKS